MPPGHRDLAAGEPLHSPGGELQQVTYVAGFPAGVADGVSGLPDLQLGQFLDVSVDHRGEAAQQPGPVGGGGRRPAAMGSGGSGDGGVDVVPCGGRDDGDDFLGGRVQDVQRIGHVVASQVCGSGGFRWCGGRRGPGYRRSKERRSSQSVTAES
ncbi:hypothetical protein GCM10020254_66020 [Streptomyces goshikiensis]